MLSVSQMDCCRHAAVCTIAVCLHELHACTLMGREESAAVKVGKGRVEEKEEVARETESRLRSESE